MCACVFVCVCACVCACVYTIACRAIVIRIAYHFLSEIIAVL